MAPPKRHDLGTGDGHNLPDAAAAETMFATPASDTQVVQADANQTVFREASPTVVVGTSRPPAPAPAPAVASRGTIQAAKKGSRSRTMLVAGGVAALLVAAAVVVVLMQAPVPTGVLVVDAAPWAYITRIQAEDGSTIPLPPSATTPLSLTVAAGKYQVSLKGQAPASAVRQVNVEVKADGVQIAPPAQFEAVSVEDYFAPYLDVAPPEPDAETTP